MGEILQDGDVHIIAVEDIIKDESKEFVHHFVMTGYFFNYTFTRALDSMSVYGWAPGVDPLVVDQCGFRASKTTGIDFLQLQIHYDNPEKKEGILDTSGVRIYYTRDLKAHDCSSLGGGQFDKVENQDPWLIPGKTKYVYECLDIGVNEKGEDVDWNGIPEITVFSDNLHMHAVGREMWSEIKPAGGEWITTSSIEFWDFNFQSFQKPVIGEYKLKKGDSLRVTCIYETELGESTHKYGLASQDEMPFRLISIILVSENWMVFAVTFLLLEKQFVLWRLMFHLSQTLENQKKMLFVLSRQQQVRRLLMIVRRQCQESAVPSCILSLFQYVFIELCY